MVSKVILVRSLAVTLGDGVIVNDPLVAVAVGIETVAEASGVVPFKALTTIFWAPQPESDAELLL